MPGHEIKTTHCVTYVLSSSALPPTTGQEKDINGAHQGRDSIKGKGDLQNESEFFGSEKCLSWLGGVERPTTIYFLEQILMVAPKSTIKFLLQVERPQGIALTGLMVAQCTVGQTIKFLGNTYLYINCYSSATHYGVLLTFNTFLDFNQRCQKVIGQTII